MTRCLSYCLSVALDHRRSVGVSRSNVIAWLTKKWRYKFDDLAVWQPIIKYFMIFAVISQSGLDFAVSRSNWYEPSSKSSSSPSELLQVGSPVHLLRSIIYSLISKSPPTVRNFFCIWTCCFSSDSYVHSTDFWIDWWGQIHYNTLRLTSSPLAHGRNPPCFLSILINFSLIHPHNYWSKLVHQNFIMMLRFLKFQSHENLSNCYSVLVLSSLFWYIHQEILTKGKLEFIREFDQSNEIQDPIRQNWDQFLLIALDFWSFLCTVSCNLNRLNA